MSNEKPIEAGGWKDRLDSLDVLPGEPWADKSASWDKLHRRLHQNPGRRKPAWWLAAALLLLISVALLLVKQPKKELVRHDRQATPVHVQGPESLTLIKNYPVRTITRAAKPHLRRLSPVNSSTTTAVRVDTLAMPLAPGIQPVMADTALLARAAVQPKKKLRVVHVNELGSPAPDEIQWTSKPAYSPQRFFRLLLINTETSSSAAAEKPADGTGPFTIKTPVKN